MESYINLDKNMLVNTTIGDVEVAWHYFAVANQRIKSKYQSGKAGAVLM